MAQELAYRRKYTLPRAKNYRRKYRYKFEQVIIGPDGQRQVILRPIKLSKKRKRLHA